MISSDSNKHVTSEKRKVNDYVTDMSLTIRKLAWRDFGTYICHAKNSFGDVEGKTQLTSK